MHTRDNWDWPEAPISIDEIRTSWDDALQHNISYSTGNVLGFPGSVPNAHAIEAATKFLPAQPNHIGVHTCEQVSEMGFPGTQTRERDFIYRLGSLMGAVDPPQSIEGYVCNGGTDGNDHGMWLGRNWLWKEVEPDGHHGIAVIASHLAHYSITKHFQRLFCHEASGSTGFRQRGNQLYLVPTNAQGEIDHVTLGPLLVNLFELGYRRFLIVLTVGTTNLGTIDAVASVNEMVVSLERQWLEGGKRNVGFYIHVDAAFGGMFVPFVYPSVQFGFTNGMVRSMVVDMHKLGGVPYPGGVFLTRKGMLQYTRTDAPYLYGHEDVTVPGSRSGAAAMACWTAMRANGFEGYRAQMQLCMQMTERLRSGLRRLVSGEETLYLYPTRMNIQAVCFPPRLEERMERVGEGDRRLWERYCIPRIDNFPADLTRPGGSGIMRNRVYRFCLMPHVRPEQVDAFLAELAG